jgi:SAM-dependent methyltransferase
MPLADVSRLAALDEGFWTALAARLRAIGATPEHAAESLRVGRASEALPRQPLPLWHLRRRVDAAATALRLFFLADSVGAEAAQAALGALFEPGLGAGLLSRADGDVTCPFRFAYVEDLLLLSDPLDGQRDDDADAVMGPGSTTAELARIARPSEPVASLLDLGCGAGTLALLFAPRTARAVGTDVNARAILMARLNAALNARAVEWREGDLFAPVAGETFELVVAQPPFVPRPAGVLGATYLHGGARGDELALRVLADLPASLAPGGRGVVLAMWPTRAGDPLAARVARALGADALGITIFAGAPFELDDWCTMCAARAHPSLGPEFDESAIALRAHLGDLGVDGFALAAVVVERRAEGRGWSTTFPGLAMDRLDAAHVEATLRAQRLAAGPDDALLEATLRAPVGATFHRDGADAARFEERFGDDAPWPTLVFDDLTYAVAATLASAPDVRTAVDSMAARAGAPREDILRAVREALARGVVAVV